MKFCLIDFKWKWKWNGRKNLKIALNLPFFKKTYGKKWGKVDLLDLSDFPKRRMGIVSSGLGVEFHFKH